MCSAWQRATSTGGNREAWTQVLNAVQQSSYQERTIVSLMAIAIIASKLCPTETLSRLAGLLCDNLEECHDSLFMATLLHMLHAALASSAFSENNPQKEALGLIFDKVMTLALQGGEPACHLQVHARHAARDLVGH